MDLTSAQLRGCLHIGVDLVDVASLLRRAAEVDGVGRLRREVDRLQAGPILRTGLDAVDLILERWRRLELDLMARAREQVEAMADDPAGVPPVAGRPRPAPRSRPGLRIDLSAARTAGRAPIRFRNHQQESERVALAVGSMATASGALLPAACVWVEPSDLEVPGGSLAQAHLVVDLAGCVVEAGTYVGELQINGSTRQGIPVEIVVLGTQPAAERT